MFNRRTFLMGVGSVVAVAAVPKLTKELEVFKGGMLDQPRNPMLTALLDRSLFVSLHSAAPIGDLQDSNEARYVPYERQRVPRTQEGWELLRYEDGKPYIANKNEIVFPWCVSGTDTVTHFAVGGNIAGCNRMLFYGEIDFGYGFTRGLFVGMGTQLKFDKRALKISF